MTAAQAPYEHTQPGYVTAGACVAGIGAVLLGLPDPRTSTTAGVTMAGLAAVGTLFSSLTTAVDEKAFRFWFGPGFWRKSFPLESIREVRGVRNPWYYGWGIRYTPHGWLYNVSGQHAVELELRDGTTLRVGTDEPDKLAQVLNEAVSTA